MTKMGRPKEDNAKRKSITMTEVALRSLEEYLSKRK